MEVAPCQDGFRAPSPWVDILNSPGHPQICG
jgi:hypothetical protein